MTHLTFQERKNIKLVNNGLITKEILNNDFNNISQCIVHTITAGLLPFLISTRFKYIDLNSIIDGKDDIISIKNDSKTVWELFELFLFDKVNRNEDLNWDFNKVINSDMIKNPIKNKLYNIIYKNKYTWNKNKIFNVLTENVCEFDKKTIGDVPTSYNLVKEILGHINTFGDGSCIDMTCGNGTFLWEVKRIAIQNGYDEKYVMNNIFGVDINLLKCYITSALLDPTDEYESNIYCGDALHTDTGNIFNMKKFKYIVGNPPFQDAEGTNKIWQYFLNKVDDLAGKSGIIAFLTPSIWVYRKGNKTKNARSIACRRGIQYLDLTASNHFSNIGENICAFILGPAKKTTIKYNEDNGSIAVSYQTLTNIDQILLSKSFNIERRIMRKVSHYPGGKLPTKRNKQLRINENLANGTLSKIKTSEYKYGYWHTISQKFYSNTLYGDGEALKIIINLSGYYYNAEKPEKYIFMSTDMSGKGTLHILTSCKDEGNRIIKLLTSKLYRFYVNTEKTGGFNNGVTHLPQLDISRTWTDDELYEHFNLTSEEIKYIEDTVK